MNSDEFKRQLFRDRDAMFGKETGFSLLEQDNRKLREALEAIVSRPHEPKWRKVEIARAALEDEGSP